MPEDVRPFQGSYSRHGQRLGTLTDSKHGDVAVSCEFRSFRCRGLEAGYSAQADRLRTRVYQVVHDFRALRIHVAVDNMCEVPCLPRSDADIFCRGRGPAPTLRFVASARCVVMSPRSRSGSFAVQYLTGFHPGPWSS